MPPKKKKAAPAPKKKAPASKASDDELAGAVSRLSLSPLVNLFCFEKGKPTYSISSYEDPATRQLHFMVYVTIERYLRTKDYTAELIKPNIVKVTFHKTASDAAYLTSEQLIYQALKGNPDDETCYDDVKQAQVNALTTAFELLGEQEEEPLIIEMPVDIDVAKGFYNPASMHAKENGNVLSHSEIRDPYQLKNNMDPTKCKLRDFSFLSLYIEAADKPKVVARKGKAQKADTSASDEAMKNLYAGRRRTNQHQIVQDLGTQTFEALGLDPFEAGGGGDDDEDDSDDYDDVHAKPDKGSSKSTRMDTSAQY